MVNFLKNNRSYSYPVLLILLIISILVGLKLGVYETTYADITKGLWALLSNSDQIEKDYVIFNIRLPRILLAGLTGAGLAVSGAAIQGLFRNPLADHTLIGVSNGAMLFAVLAIILGGSIFSGVSEIFKSLTVGIFAFFGGIVTTFLVFALASKRGVTSVTTMLMAGIAISSFTAAIAGIFIYMSDDQQLRDITFWTMGSFAGANWLKLAIVSPFIVFGMLMLFRLARPLNAILLGEAEAAYIGVLVQKVKLSVIVYSSLIVGVCISVTGIIGFVGLIIPHFIRLIYGADYRFLLKSSALLGALFVVFADTIARNIIAPAELPIGIITAMIGAPFFLWLLIQKRNQNLSI